MSAEERLEVIRGLVRDGFVSWVSGPDTAWHAWNDALSDQTEATQ